MLQISEFITDKSGPIAATVVVLGLVATSLGIVRPMLQRRREAHAGRARLVFSDLRISAPPPHSEAGELRFQLMNSGGGKAVLRSLRLVVLSSRPSESLRMVEAAAPIPEHSHKVRLDPHIPAYDVRDSIFGPPPAPLSFVRDEVESFVVELSSAGGWWYRFRLVADWYATSRPNEPQSTETAELEIDFPASPAELLAREGQP